MANIPNKGNLFVIAAPSGTGKTSLVRGLLGALPGITVSISHTTRPPRSDEQHGVNYYFTEEKNFQEMVQHGDFLEYATIFGYHYGTSKQWVKSTLKAGIDVILEIDWQGHQQIKRLFSDTIGIFILPPSLHELQHRLVKRNQDTPEVIAERIADVREAVHHIPDFDYVVINDNFDHALSDLQSIVSTSRLLERRQAAHYGALIEELSTLGL